MHSFRPSVPLLALLLLAGCTTVATVPARKVEPSKPEAAALAVLATSADEHEKARACQELALMAGPASVPALAALLTDEHLSDYARSALESIRDPAAGIALQQALPTLQGRLLAGAVNSLGVRRDAAAVSELRMLAIDERRGVAADAVAALGLIANAEAARVLGQILATGPAGLKTPAAHAALVAAERLEKEGNASAARTLRDAVNRARPIAATGRTPSAAR